MNNTTFIFDADVAKEYGLKEAIVIKCFQFWIEKNKANDKHFIDGHYWTYNSVSAWQKLLPFFTLKQIRTTLDSLVKQGVLIKGSYNETPFDRTCWYAFAQEEKWLSPDGQRHLPERAQTFAQMGKPIPDNKPDNIPDNNPPYIYKYIYSPQNEKNSFDWAEVVKRWNEVATKWGLATIKSLTESRKQKFVARYRQSGCNSLEEYFALLYTILQQSLFLRGKKISGYGENMAVVNADWRASFDFFMQESSWQKAMEGVYADKDLMD